MKAAIIGYGRMGHEIEKVLTDRGHTVVATLDVADAVTVESLAGADVAIEFTTPDTAFGNITKCLRLGVAVVSGTTGWNDKLPDAEKLCRELGGTMFHASNFSIGVNIFFHVNEVLARIMNGYPNYEVSIKETHHDQKKDAPSGTAITIAECIMDNMERKSSWVNHETLYPESIGILSIREGNIAGIHEVKYESSADTIELIHSSTDRSGLAMGAVLAAEYAAEHKGVLTMKDLLKI